MSRRQMAALLLIILAFLAAPGSFREFKVASKNMWGLDATHSKIKIVPKEIFLRNQQIHNERYTCFCGESCDVVARVGTVISEICSAGYDFVLFQELWRERDVNRMADSLKRCGGYHVTKFGDLSVSGCSLGKKLPWASFSCSGLTVASKFRFVSTQFTTFNKNTCSGYDCYATKGMGRVRVRVPIEGVKVTIDLFVTHTQADENDVGQMRRHRYLQMRQVLPQVHLSNADLVILGGDFNDVPSSPVIHLVAEKLRNSALDVVSMPHYVNNESHLTYGNPKNMYTVELPSKQKGILDYIFYRKPGPQSPIDIHAKDYQLVDKYLGSGSLSDHTHLFTTFDVTLKSNSSTSHPISNQTDGPEGVKSSKSAAQNFYPCLTICATFIISNIFE